MINTIFKKPAETLNKETVSKAIGQPAPEPAPIDSSPLGLAKAAAEAAGFVVNQEYHAKTTKHKPQNRNLIWCRHDSWGEPVLFAINNSADWPANETIYGVYVGPNGQGVLQFQNRDGIRRNRWKSRS